MLNNGRTGPVSALPPMRWQLLRQKQDVLGQSNRLEPNGVKQAPYALLFYGNFVLF
jgi:hypothetical protein